jgi:hypothetical protein
MGIVHLTHWCFVKRVTIAEILTEETGDANFAWQLSNGLQIPQETIESNR